jgi:predicted phosphoribosyltransferase
MLTESEAADRVNVFDIALLAERLLLGTAWVQNLETTARFPVGYFGASTGAAAALVAAARLGRAVSAVVSGAIVDGEEFDEVIDEAIIAELGVPQAYLDEEIARQARQIERRRQLYPKCHPSVDVRYRTALVVHDGIATGATMRAVPRHGPEKVVMAVLVAPSDIIELLRADVDEIVCLATPKTLQGDRTVLLRFSSGGR